MPELKDNERDTITAVVGTEARRQLSEVADELTQEREKKFYASDVVREAVEEYLRKRGRVITIKVDRGGYRERHDTPPAA